MNRTFPSLAWKQAVATAILMGLLFVTGPTITHAASIAESPTSVGTLSVTGAASPNPNNSLVLGGSLLENFVGSPDSGGSYSESAFKFNLSSLAGAQINSATFTFTIAGATPIYDSPSLNVSGYPSSSPTVTISDFTIPNVLLGATGPLPIKPSGLDQTFNIDATSYIQSLVNGGISNVGFLTSAGSRSIVYLYGDASSGVSFAPTLTVNFDTSAVPEPSSLALCGIAGLVGFVALRAARTTRVA